ncbi:MAG: hypothetical protein KDA86_17065 [Planctomycetaceae bacterium]|nr:hypothetical protein [Planctomycetaceae bacterium]
MTIETPTLRRFFPCTHRTIGTLSRSRRVVVAAMVLLMVTVNVCSAESTIDLRTTVLISPVDGRVGKAAATLSDAVYERSGIRWYIREHFPGACRIVLSTVDDLPDGVEIPAGLVIPDAAEGFAIGVDGETVLIIGRDERGILFGVGRLLRELTMRQGEIHLPSDTQISTSPRYPMRVHQLGYRNGATSYDLWTVAKYEQYLRELSFFGCNGAELIQELPPGEKDSVLLAEPEWDMNMRLSKLLDDYDLDVFVWYPVPILGDDKELYERELGYRERFFNEMSRIDHVFVPGGDPGDNHPRILMPALKVMADMLHKPFPDAGVFVSNQKMPPEWTEWMFNYIREDQPTWLGGYVYGPGTEHHSIKEAREWLPKQYQIRRYPDITHNVRAQFPVPHWDDRMAQTLDREGINPRPGHNHLVHNAYDEYASGFGTYSDGINDDLNKTVWSALGWDPDADIHEIVLDYGRLFFGEDVGQDAADGLWMLQDNMEGNLLTNEGIPQTLAKWREIGQKVTPEVRRSWRYQMYLMRAIFDHYTRERYLAEHEYEQAAYAALMKSPKVGATAAIAEARKEFARADSVKIGVPLREEMSVLADGMFNSIGYQFSVKPPYFTRNPERGALLDKLDVPMNDRPWLESQFDRIQSLKTEKERLEQIEVLVNWDDPGPGGFYDDLGDPERQTHVDMLSTFEENPSRLQRVTEGHYRWMNNETLQVDNRYRYSWLHHCQTFPGAPLIMRYDGLDPNAEYKVKVVEFGRFGSTLDLTADGEYRIHGPMKIEYPIWPREFDIPKAVTSDGKLELEWGLVEGRGIQVAEVWLIKKP